MGKYVMERVIVKAEVNVTDISRSNHSSEINLKIIGLSTGKLEVVIVARGIKTEAGINIIKVLF